MRPSTKVKLAVALGAAAALATAIVVLPRLRVWFGSAQTGLQSRTTEHFIVYASDPKRAERAGVEAEAFAAAFVRRWGPRHGFALPDPPVALYFFDDHAGLSRHGLLKMGESLENNGGYFSAAERAIALVRGDSAGVRHEMTHMMDALAWRDAEVSPWFAEGHAQWHEAGVEGGPPPLMMARARQLERTESWLSLGHLLEAPPAAFSSAGNTIVYAESAALFSWLALSDPAALDRVFELERRPLRPTPEEFARALGAPLDDIEARWRKWLANGR